MFVVPDFDYLKMVLGETQARWAGCAVEVAGYLDRDGFLPVVTTPTADVYGILRARKIGLFNIGLRKEILPEYAWVARMNKKLFVAKKDSQWLIINDDGNLKSFGRSKYINFLDNYILVGN